MDATDITIVVGAVSSILAFLASIANMINTNYKEARNRRWAQEDKEELARTTRHTVKETGQSASNHFAEQKLLLEEIIRAGEQRLQTIVCKVEENTQISKEAFKEANGINNKLQTLGIEIRDKKAPHETSATEPLVP